MYRVFISYPRKEPELPGVAKMYLDAKQIPVWFDETTLKTGVRLLGSLRDALEQCEVCLFFATDESLKSEWCRLETAAFWALKKPVLTHLGKGLSIEALPQYLREGVVRDDIRIIIDEIVGTSSTMTTPGRADTLTEDRLYSMLRDILGPLSVDQQLEDRALSLRGLLDRIRASALGSSSALAVESRLGAYLGLPVDAIVRAFADTWDTASLDESTSVLTASVHEARYLVRFGISHGICVGVGVAERGMRRDEFIASVGASGSLSAEELVRHA